jgi:hypothetical protein
LFQEGHFLICKPNNIIFENLEGSADISKCNRQPSGYCFHASSCHSLAIGGALFLSLAPVQIFGKRDLIIVAIATGASWWFGAARHFSMCQLGICFVE